MEPPGPGGALWAVALVAYALGFALVGDVVRAGLARYVAFLRAPEPFARGVLDLYLGGAVLYVLAALPVGAFYPPLPAAVLGVGAAAFVVRAVRSGRRGRDAVRVLLASLRTPPSVIALASTVVVLGLEVAAVGPVGTGNTFDSSLFTTYVALLGLHHTVPLSFAPLASQGLPYPQGPTVWFAAAQALFGLPPARTSLLVTPLFLALAVPASFVVGRRWLGSEWAGAAFALTFALLASWPRLLVAGSNDFALALPLVLLLLAESDRWTGRAPIPAADAVAFGALLGYSAALNPVGAEWWFLTLPAAALLARPRFAGAVRRWWMLWAAAVASALPFVLPSLLVLARGAGSPGLVPGAAPLPPGSPTNLSVSQLIGSLDPFLFRPGDIALSPFPILRLELAVLLAAGGVAILLGRRLAALAGLGASRLGRFALAGTVVAAALMALETVADPGTPVLSALPYVTSVGELSIAVFVVFAFVAAYPLAVLLALAAAPAGPPPGAAEGEARAATRRPHRWRTGAAPISPAAAAVLAAAVLLPGAVTTGVSFPSYVGGLYADFSNVTGADFALLDWCGTHLPAGSRVLVAPGSAAEFVPGYAADLVLYYPMMANFRAANASYALLVDELTRGTLDPAGLGAIAALDLGWILVTQNNSVLYPPFSPAPLAGDSAHFRAAFHEGDAYAFAVVRPPTGAAA